MIVILLIGLISGVVSYNLKGTLDKGKAFRSEQGAKRLADILNLEIQMGHINTSDLIKNEDLSKNKEKLLSTWISNSGLINPKEVDSFLKDGWNKPYKIECSPDGAGITVTSPELDEYNKRHGIAVN